MLTAAVSTPPTDRHAAFLARRASAGPKVRAIIAAGRLADPEAAEQTVWLRAWQAYPRMVACEAAGHVHSWDAWLCQIARRVVIDAARREVARRRLWGGEAVRLVDGALRALDPDDWPDPSGLGDPELVVERLAWSEALAALPGQQRLAIAGWLAGWSERAIAHRLGVTTAGVKQLKQRALMRLRAYYRRRVE